MVPAAPGEPKPRLDPGEQRHERVVEPLGKEEDHEHHHETVEEQVQAGVGAAQLAADDLAGGAQEDGADDGTEPRPARPVLPPLGARHPRPTRTGAPRERGALRQRAAHLVDAVLPRVPVRERVLTMPYRLRYRMAWDHGLSRRRRRVVSPS